MTLERLPNEEVRRSAVASSSPATSDAGGDPWVPTGSPWLRWLRPRRSSGGSSSRSCGALPPQGLQQPGAGEAQLLPADVHISRQQFDALEDRLLRLVAGMHQQLNQQVAADREESDQLAERAASRFEVQISMAEQHRQRAERRMTELTAFLQNLEEEQQAQGRRMALLGDMLHSTQASRSQDQIDMQHRIADIEEDQRSLSAQSMAFAAQGEEAQRHYSQRFRPIEDRLSALENERRRSEAFEPINSDTSGATNAEATLLDEARTVHDRCNHMQDVVDNHVLHPMRQLERRVEAQERRMGLQASKLEEQEGQLVNVKEWLEGMSTRLSNGIKCDKLCDPWAHHVGNGLSARKHACDEATLELRIDACEHLSRQLREQFAERCAELARCVQAGFTEARGHLEEVSDKLAQLDERVIRAEEMRGCAKDFFSEDLSAVSLDRIEQLEQCVRENAVATGAMREHVHLVQGRLGDIKEAINLAICEQRSRSETSRCEGDGRSFDAMPISLETSEVCQESPVPTDAVATGIQTADTTAMMRVRSKAREALTFSAIEGLLGAACQEAEKADEMTMALEIAVPACSTAPARTSQTAREAELVLGVAGDCDIGSEAPAVVKEFEEQLARLSENFCLQENIVAALQGQLRDSAARSSEFECQLARLFEAQAVQQSSIASVHGQVKDLPQQLAVLASRVGGLEADACDTLGARKAAKELELKVASLEARLACRHDTSSVDCRATAERLDRAELMVSEIPGLRGQVSDLGRQVEESSSRLVPLELRTEPANCSTNESVALTAMPRSAAAESPMARADAFLCAVGQIISKQQVELSRLLAEVNMQFREVATREICDGEEEAASNDVVEAAKSDAAIKDVAEAASATARAAIADVVEADAGAGDSLTGTGACTELEARHMSEVAEALTSWVKDSCKAASQAVDSGPVDSPVAARYTDGAATADDVESCGEEDFATLPTRGLGLRPFSAIALLSATLTDFEAALSGAEDRVEEAAGGTNESS